MELKVINDKGEAQASVPASETLFGRAYNEALVHQVVVAYQANGRAGTRAQKTACRGAPHHEEAVAPEGHRARPRGHDVEPAVARRRAHLPELAGRELRAEGQPKMYRAGMASILSQLVREGRLAVVDGLTVDQPKTKLLAGKLQAPWAWTRCWSSPTSWTRTCTWPRATCPTCWCSSRATPIRVSARALQEGARDPRRGRAARGGTGMNQERLMYVIVAPIDLGEGDPRGRDPQPGRVQGPARRHQARDQGGGGAAVQRSRWGRSTS